jgi:hypothetical protein
MEKRWYRQENTVVGTNYHTIYLPLWKNPDATVQDLINTSGNVRLVKGTKYHYGVLSGDTIDIEKTVVKDY